MSDTSNEGFHAEDFGHGEYINGETIMVNDFLLMVV
jgi:hypothetical protein